MGFLPILIYIYLLGRNEGPPCWQGTALAQQLDVEPQQVIPGQAESTDGWHGSDTAMRSVPV